MNRIEQTTLNFEDINEHSTFLLQAGTDKQIVDDMLERFIHTFLADKPESEVTG